MKEQYANAQPTSPDSRLRDNPDRTPEADKRLDVLDEVVRGYQADHAFVRGATVFGSTMHGRAHEKSDIDAFVFVDPEAAEREAGGEVLDAADYSDMAKVVEHDLATRVGLQLHEQSSGRRNDVQLFLINPEIIDGSISAFEAEAEAKAAFDAKVERARDAFWEADFTEDETLEDFAKREHGIDLDDEPSPAMVEWGVAALFHPGVGDTTALESDRQAVLDRLAMSPAAEEAWRDIALRVQSFEGDTHTDQSTFPQTFAEAQQAYGRAA